MIHLLAADSEVEEKEDRRLVLLECCMQTVGGASQMEQILRIEK
jgi:hypothetical protein